MDLSSFGPRISDSRLDTNWGCKQHKDYDQQCPKAMGKQSIFKRIFHWWRKMFCMRNTINYFV